MIELIDLVHEREAASKYSRGLVMYWFSRAFQLTARDFTSIIFACEVFGDGASMGVAEAERRFQQRLEQLEGRLARDDCQS